MSSPFIPDAAIPNTANITSVFGDAKHFKIGKGNFYVVAGNMYRGTRPESEDPDNPHRPQPSQLSCFDGATTFDIDSADFLVIRGHFFDADRAASSTSDPQPTSHAAPGQLDPRSTVIAPQPFGAPAGAEQAAMSQEGLQQRNRQTASNKRTLVESTVQPMKNVDKSDNPASEGSPGKNDLQRQPIALPVSSSPGSSNAPQPITQFQARPSPVIKEEAKTAQAARGDEVGDYLGLKAAAYCCKIFIRIRMILVYGRCMYTS
ncbi:hypothetical protein BJ912DRAFT_1045722, partial [Pholiota molesta]